MSEDTNETQIGKDTTFDQMPAFFTFVSEETERFEYDSKGRVRTFERVLPGGKRNQVQHLLMRHGGTEVWVPLGSTRLIGELKKLGTYKGQIDITPHGDGTQRTWTVTAVKAK